MYHKGDLGLRNCKWECVPSEGASGGLISVWDDGLLKMDDVFKSQRMLLVKFSSIKDDFSWAGANVYGPNDDSLRDDLWTSISDGL